MPFSITDSWRFLSKVTLKRVWNAGLVLGSYFYSKAIRHNHHLGFPISISIEPTTSCNLRCPECPSGLRSFTRPTGMLEKDLFEKIIDEQKDTLLYLILYFQGEPYLNKNFFDYISFASSRRIYTATSTNAHYLDEKNSIQTVKSGLDRLIISIDGFTQESYETYRIGGQVNKVISGTKNLLAARKILKSQTPYVIWQFIVFKHNEHEIEAVKRLGKELGVDKVAIKTAQVYDYENGSDLIPESGDYARYAKGADGKYQLKNEMADHCWRMWSSPVITWDGKVIPCCFDKDADHALGNVQDQSFATVWKSSAYNLFRASILRSRSEIEICKNCTEGTKVWA
jgi:radical SAM protein with 4Fe4S-binding SPASM domain